MNDMATVIIPARESAAVIGRCLTSLMRSTCAGSLQILVADMGSDDGTEAAVRAFPGVRFFRTGGNTGRCHALNCGLHLVRTPYAVILSPYVTVGRHCIERLCAALEKKPYAFCAQPVVCRGQGGQKTYTAGTCLPVWGRPYPKRAIRGGAAQIFAPEAEAAAYRMEALEETGIFDERFYAGLEEVDLAYRAAFSGFTAAVVHDAFARSDAPAGRTPFCESVETGNLLYMLYKNMPGPQRTLNEPFLRAGLRDRKRRLSASGREELWDAALERGQDLCMDAEYGSMRQEDGLDPEKLPLPETFGMKVKDAGVEEIYPLIVGARTVYGFRDIGAALRIQRAFWRDSILYFRDRR